MMDEKLNFSYLFGSNAPYIEELYEKFLENPESVDEKWKQYFTDLSKQPGAVAVDVAHTPIRESFATLAKKKIASAVAGGVDEAMMKKQVSVLRLISAYRIQGVGAAQLDPLKRIPPQTSKHSTLNSTVCLMPTWRFNSIWARATFPVKANCPFLKSSAI